MARVKLTDEQIEKIEDICTMYMDGLPQRAIIVKHNIEGIPTFAGFVRTMKDIGVLEKPIKQFGGLNRLDPNEAIAVANYLAELRKAKESKADA